MKKISRFFVLLIISIVIAIGLFFINSSVITTTWVGKIAEIGFLTIPVFIVVTLLYYANRALVKTVKGISKKKPSQQEGPKV